MKTETIVLTRVFDHMDRVELINSKGDIYTSKSEELMDFLHDAAPVSSQPDSQQPVTDDPKLLVGVLLRRTGALSNHDGTYTINYQDLYNWFENQDHLKKYTLYDLL